MKKYNNDEENEKWIRLNKRAERIIILLIMISIIVLAVESVLYLMKLIHVIE